MRCSALLRASVLILVPTALEACVTMQEFPINSRAPDLHIPPAEKIALRVAVVVPDPLGGQFLFSARTVDSSGRETSNRTVDKSNTPDAEGIYPIGRELVKLSQDAFSQAFTDVTVLRQLPAPAQFDAVIRVAVSEAHVYQLIKIGFLGVGSGDTVGVTLRWSLTVLDQRNVEVFATTNTTPVKERTISLGLSSSPLFTAVGDLTSDQLDALAPQFVDLALTSGGLRNPAPAREKADS